MRLKQFPVVLDFENESTNENIKKFYNSLLNREQRIDQQKF
jgi:hypothetical protein